MKTFDPFSTTNALYGKFYTRKIPYYPPESSFTKPKMEEEFREATLKMREKYFDPHAHLNLGNSINSNNKNENKEIEKKLNNQTDNFFNKMLPLIQTRKWLQQKYSKPIPTQFYIGNRVKREIFRKKTPPYFKNTFKGIQEKKINEPETTYQYSYQFKFPVRFGSDIKTSFNKINNNNNLNSNLNNNLNLNNDNNYLSSNSNINILRNTNYDKSNFNNNINNDTNFNIRSHHQRNKSDPPNYNQIIKMIQSSNLIETNKNLPNINLHEENNNLNNNNNNNNINEEENQQNINIDKVCFSKVGLENDSNDDYINSSIQILIHCPPFIYTFINDFQRKIEMGKEKGKITSSFIELLLNFSNCPDGKFFPIKNFKNIFQSLHSNLKNNNHEFIRFFLQDINNELNRNNNKSNNNNLISIPQSNKINMFNEYRKNCILKEDSIITDLFIGYMSFEFICKCGSKDFSFGQFIDIPLLFENENLNEYDLNNLIKINILRNEIIQINETCKNCEKIYDRQQKIRIANLPQLLILSIQRINFFTQKKNNTKISFNEVLDLKEIVDNEIFDNSNTNYRLWGIIYHKGNNLNNGHYYSYIKIKGNWFCFDDKNVINDIPDFNSSEVNTLFYTRINN